MFGFHEAERGSTWYQGDPRRIIGVIRAEQPTGISIYELVVDQQKFRKKLVTIHIIDVTPRIAPPYAIFVVMIKSIALPLGTIFGQSVRIQLAAFAKNDQFRVTG
jgi:hypothetical protein